MSDDHDVAPCPACGSLPFFGRVSVPFAPVPGNIGCLACHLSPNNFRLYDCREDAVAAWNAMCSEKEAG